MLPAANHYCEPFGGSAAVLLNRDPAPVETYNDIDGEVVNFFRVLREQKDALIYAIGMTPFSREEFVEAISTSRELTLIQLDTKLDIARAHHISELLFVVEQGKQLQNIEAIDARINSEFVSGQNVYVVNFADFSLGILILFGEDGRVEFLREVGHELDRVSSRIEHRRAWADLLKQA